MPAPPPQPAAIAPNPTGIQPAELACVCLPHFALQVLGTREPACLAHPAVIVTEDRPQGLVREANRLARTHRIQVGMRYAQALALCADLRAATVEPAEELAAAAALVERLRRFSPRVEPAHQVERERGGNELPGEVGVFWLDVTGLGGLWPNLRDWAAAVRAELAAAGYKATVVVGFSRCAVYAAARQGFVGQGQVGQVEQGVLVFADRAAEQAARDRVHLASLGPGLGVAPADRDALDRLGIRTLGQLLQLPEADLRERHGEAVRQLHRRARDVFTEPLRPSHAQQELARHRDLEPPDDQRDRLLFIAKGLLAELLKAAAERHLAIAELHLRLELEVPHHHRQINQAAPRPGCRLVTTQVQTAEPSLWEPHWLELLRLRLDATQLPARVERLGLRAETVAASAQQLKMWQLLAEAGGLARRDPQAAAEALARLKAALGDDVVRQAELQPAHLPEAQWRWAPLRELSAAKPTPPSGQTLGSEPQLVRRILSKPALLPSRPKHEPDGWLLADWRQGAVTRRWGPYRVAGGWWSREVRRDYWFVETERGDILWVFYDGVRRLWYWQGRVE
ncbi:MAG: DNA polymerase Y family protein [Deltaproteobacteria bacterium]|nr:DNA polymerase Y family protein [Deltaproteobacteria bacterium]